MVLGKMSSLFSRALQGHSEHDVHVLPCPVSTMAAANPVGHTWASCSGPFKVPLGFS